MSSFKIYNIIYIIDKEQKGEMLHSKNVQQVFDYVERLKGELIYLKKINI